MAWIDSWAGNYMLVLLIIAVLFELLLLPFGIKQQKNSIKQAKLRPKEMAIRKKYAGRNDRVTQQKVAMEVQELYKAEGYNQFGGCLPLLLQLPIILALYNVVIKPLEYVVQLNSTTITAIRTLITEKLGADVLAGDNGSIKLLTVIKEQGLEFFSQNNLDGAAYADLESHFSNLPDFNFFGINMGATPVLRFDSKEALLLLIIPVLTFVVYFLSMKLTRKFSYQPAVQDEQVGCSNNIMDFMMPMFSLFITFGVPAAVGVYWIYKSIVGTLKQFILSKVMPIPVPTEAEIKAAEKEMKGKAPLPEREAPANPVKSLHHEDDEDDEPYPTFVGVKGGRYDDDSTESAKAPEAPAKNDSLLGDAVESAPLKEDKKSDKSAEDKTSRYDQDVAWAYGDEKDTEDNDNDK